MAGSMLGLLIAAWGMLRLEERAKWSEESTRWSGAASPTTAGVLALIVVLGIATSKGGPGQFFDDAWHEFTKTSQDKDSDPTRIISSNSGNRWVWWKEAAGAWTRQAGRRLGRGLVPGDAPPVPRGRARRPAAAQRAAAVPRRDGDRRDGARHGRARVPAVRGVRAGARDARRPRARHRGRAVRGRGRVARARGRRLGLGHPRRDDPGARLHGRARGDPRAARDGVGARRRTRRTAGRSRARAAALVVVCLLLGLVIVSALLPCVGELEGDLVAGGHDAGGRARARERRRRGGGRRAPGPDGRSRSLLAAADLAQNRGRLVDARRYLLQAVDRQPYSVVAWRRLLQLALATADRRGREGGRRAAARARPDRQGDARARRAARAVQRAGERLADGDRDAAEPGLHARAPDGDADAADRRAGGGHPADRRTRHGRREPAAPAAACDARASRRD